VLDILHLGFVKRVKKCPGEYAVAALSFKFGNDLVLAHDVTLAF
jgi:hypothetical protein